MPRELLTLQLGSYANYVGAHYWNFQDELLGYADRPQWQPAASAIASEVLLAWREDKHGNLQYYPRTVLLDVSGSLGGVSLSADSASRKLAAQMGVDTPACGTWHSGVEVHAAEAVQASHFTQQLYAAEDVDEEDEAAVEAHQAALEEAAGKLGREVEFWTDYLKAPVHPNTPLSLPGVWSGVSDIEGFGGAAAALLGSPQEVVETASDKLRWWAEQCDSLQGVQVLSDDLGGYGSLGSQLLEHLQDDYPRTPLLYFSLRQSAAGTPADPLQRARLQLGEGLSLAQAGHLSSLYFPLKCPWELSRLVQQQLQLDPSNRFQTAALLAAAIDSATVPCRLSGGASSSAAQGGTDLHSIVQLLAGRCPNLVAASLQLPTGALPADEWAQAAAADSRVTKKAAEQQQAPVQYLQLTDAVLDLAGMEAAPGDAAAAAGGGWQQAAEYIVLRGVRQGPGAAAVPSAAAYLDKLLGAEKQRAVRHRCVLGMPLAIPLPFPPLFTQQVTSVGEVGTSSSSRVPEPSNAPGPLNGQAQGEQQRSAACHVSTCPQLTRLKASSSYTSSFKAAGEQLKAAAASLAGGHYLRSWGYGVADIHELQEQLMQTAGQHEDAESDGDL